MSNRQVTDADLPIGKEEKTLDQQYWESKWEQRQTGWDIGYVSPAIEKYMDEYGDKNAAILIPGCGNAHEAEYLAANGFTNITLIDISPTAVAQLNAKYAKSQHVKIVCGDFFDHIGVYDLMIEQTFFCALPPAKRPAYVVKAASLLRTSGKIIGVLFDRNFDQQGPPFGGNRQEYAELFDPYFEIKTMESCYNSIPERANTELFIHLVKK